MTARNGIGDRMTEERKEDREERTVRGQREKRKWKTVTDSVAK